MLVQAVVNAADPSKAVGSKIKSLVPLIISFIFLAAIIAAS